MDQLDFDSDDSTFDKTFTPTPASDIETASDISEISSVSSGSKFKKRKISNDNPRCISRFGDFFDYDHSNKNDKVAFCKLCKNKNVTTKLKMKNSNTSGLKKHLMSKHKSQYNILFPSAPTTSNNMHKIESQASILNMFLSQVPKDSQDTFNEKIVDWIAVKYHLPFNFFDDERTQELFKFLNSTLTVPRRTALHEKVNRRYIEMKVAVKQIIKRNSSNISFTIDGWTSVSNKSYYGITAHFVDENFELQSIVVDFLPSHGHHTGKDISNIFINFLKEFEIGNKIQGITMDNASANTTFMEELEKSGAILNVEDYHFRCFAHIINLGVQDILKLIKAEPDHDTELEDLEEENCDTGTSINKLRILFLKIKRSEQWDNKLKSCCDAVNVTFNSIKIDISTRWNSTDDMIKTALNMKPAIIALCDNNIELNDLRVPDCDWILLEEVHKILEHFKTLSTILGGESYVTLPMVIVGFNILLDKIEIEIFALDSKENRNMADEKLLVAYQSGRDKLLKHYKKTNWIYCVVLILDPRHKVETFHTTSWGKDLYVSTVEKFETIYKNKYYIEPEYNVLEKKSKNDDGRDNDFLDLTNFYENSDTSTDDWKKEINMYLHSKRAEKNTDILLWWKNHTDMYPTLLKMARDFLCIPATSVPAERLFSRAGLTIRKQRNRLNAESARSLLCSNSWCTSKLYNDIKIFMKQKK